MKFTTKPTCIQCPFVQGKTKGYIGPYESAQALHNIATTDVQFECHMTHDAEQHLHCRGIQLYRKGICKIPKDRESAKNIQDVAMALKDTETAVPPFQMVQYHGK